MPTKGGIVPGAMPIYKKRYKNAHNYDAELNMDFASHRLATFDYLHTVQTVRPDTLANAGLYLSSDGTLSCNFCFDPVNEQALWNGNLASVQQIRDNHVNAMTVKYCKINEPHNGNCDWNLSANRYEANRMASLLIANFNGQPDCIWNVPPKDLASNGFHFVCPRDKVRCVFCNLELESWTINDNVENDHRHWNPACSFLQPGQNVSNNVPIGNEILPVNLGCDGDITELKTGKELSYPKFQDKDQRIATFCNDWPYPDDFLSVEKLVDVGLFYTGHGDKVICYGCGLCLSKWAEGDDPQNIHSKFNKACPLFLKSF